MLAIVFERRGWCPFMRVEVRARPGILPLMCRVRNSCHLHCQVTAGAAVTPNHAMISKSTPSLTLDTEGATEFGISPMLTELQPQLDGLTVASHAQYQKPFPSFSCLQLGLDLAHPFK